MQFVHGITLLLLYQLVGEIGVRLLGLPVPGPVLGMFLLLLTLWLRGGSAPSLEGASSALLGHLSLLFVPAGVGLITHLPRIQQEWLPIAVTLLLSTAITLAVTATLMGWLVRGQGEEERPCDPQGRGKCWPLLRILRSRHWCILARQKRRGHSQ